MKYQVICVYSTAKRICENELLIECFSKRLRDCVEPIARSIYFKARDRAQASIEQDVKTLADNGFDRKGDRIKADERGEQ